MSQPSLVLDRPSFPTVLLPPLATHSDALQQVIERFGTELVTVHESLETPSLALVVTGPEQHAAARALARFGDVRDAARVASVLTGHHLPSVVPSSTLNVTWAHILVARSRRS